MKVLTVESSTRSLSLCLSEDDRVLTYKNAKMDHNLSDFLIPSIHSLLKKIGLSLDKIDAFAVGLGPGYFTSLRVSLATVKGLAFARHKPVIGVPSMDALAESVPESSHQICVIIDAKRNLCYNSLYVQNRNQRKRTARITLKPIEEIIKDIKCPTVFTGDAIDLYRDKIKKAAKFDFSFTDKKHWLPQAKVMSRLAYQELHKKNFKENPQLVPLYIYPEDCQVQQRRKN